MNFEFYCPAPAKSLARSTNAMVSAFKHRYRPPFYPLASIIH